jgi:hypothetical protein
VDCVKRGGQDASSKSGTLSGSHRKIGFGHEKQ